MRNTILSSLLFIALASNAQEKKPATALARPKLVVGIVVDQMRWDYLYRYYDRYGTGGFKRMLTEGFTCENTIINYVPTVTAIGHSSIYTGSVPSIHGIAGNDFIIESTGQSVYCTEDSTVNTVGSSSDAGKMSPRNLLTTTITDELKLATNFRSKVFGIALKDRGGILPAGHTADAAYWFDNATGNWITSTYYLNELPEWVKKFNARQLPKKYLDQDWNTLYNINTYTQSFADDNKYEGKFSGSNTTTFPVKTSGMYGNSYDIIRSTPYGNTLTMELAKACVENEKLGTRGVTDFLAVSFSSTDYIGHKFGVNAIEVEDTYLRLDKDLADFFTYLDTKLGKGNYSVFLSADHGAAHNPALLADKNIPAGFWNGGQVQRDLNAWLAKKYGDKKLVNNFSNSQVHLNHSQIEKLNLDEHAIKSDILEFLRKQPQVSFAVDNLHPETSGVPSALAERVRNGYNAKRSGDVTIVLDPGWYSGSASGTGTTHGSWNPYDAHIPLVWMGWGIRAGSTARETHITDIAATLAFLLHIQMPNGCIGEPINEVIKK